MWTNLKKCGATFDGENLPEKPDGQLEEHDPGQNIDRIWNNREIKFIEHNYSSDGSSL